MMGKFYWHLHHDKLVEWCWSYDERVAYIIAFKPQEEVAERLRLFQPVRGTIPPAFDQAHAAYAQAHTAYIQALDTTDSYWAGETLNRAYTTILAATADAWPALEALHRDECPDCPWDGKTIFPERGGT